MPSPAAPGLAVLRPVAPILIGAAVMLTFVMGLRQSLGLFVQPAVRDLSLAVADFTLAIAIQNLAWGVLQPVAGAKSQCGKMIAADFEHSQVGRRIIAHQFGSETPAIRQRGFDAFGAVDNMAVCYQISIGADHKTRTRSGLRLPAVFGLIGLNF